MAEPFKIPPISRISGFRFLFRLKKRRGRFLFFVGSQDRVTRADAAGRGVYRGAGRMRHAPPRGAGRAFPRTTYLLIGREVVSASGRALRHRPLPSAWARRAP